MLFAHFGVSSFVRHSSCLDLHQFLADGFRRGQIHLSIDGATTALVDSVPIGDKIFLSWGPAPAAIYALFDSIWEPLTGLAFPKLALVLAAAVAHVLALYFLLAGLIDRRRLAALIVAAAYLMSFPYWRFLTTSGFYADVLSVTYSSAFFVVSLALYSRNWRQPSQWSALGAGLFLFLACMTRQIYFLPGCVMASALLLRRRLNRDAIVFGAVALGAVFTHTSYNHARFGNPFDLGVLHGYHQFWEDIAWNFGFLEESTTDFVRRLGEAAVSWWGLPFSPVETHPVTFFEEVDEAPRMFMELNVLLVGFVAGLLMWFRRPRRYGLESTLLIALGSMLVYYQFFCQASALHYSIDLWAMTLCLSVAGAWRVVSRPGEPGPSRLRHGFTLLVAVWLVITFAGRGGSDLFDGEFAHAQTDDLRFEPRLDASRHQLPGDAVFCDYVPDGHLEGIGGNWGEGERVAPTDSVECSGPNADQSITPTTEPWLLPRSLHRFGLGREGAESCSMLFFGGATLARTPDQACRVSLELDAEGAPACESIELYLEGRPSGRLRGAQPGQNPDAVACVGDVPTAPGSQVRSWFLFTGTELPQPSRRVAIEVPRFRFHSIRMSCDEGIR